LNLEIFAVNEAKIGCTGSPKISRKVRTAYPTWI